MLEHLHPACLLFVNIYGWHICANHIHHLLGTPPVIDGLFLPPIAVRGCGHIAPTLFCAVCTSTSMLFLVLLQFPSSLIRAEEAYYTLPSPL